MLGLYYIFLYSLLTMNIKTSDCWLHK